MKIIRNLTLIIAAVATFSVASAQHYSFGGLVMDHDGMMSRDMYSLSQPGFGFGSARSMGMAGAFTSLGGDYASVGINPAGLGMYRHNEFTISPMMGFQTSENSAADFGDNGRNRFSMANVGLVLNTFESGDDSGLVSFNVAIGYNRIADLNYRYGFHSKSAPSDSPYRSINDMFVRQLGQGGLFPGNNGSLGYSFGDAYYWGGSLAYNGYLLDVGTDDLGDYWTTANRIGVNASVGHTTEVESRGSIGEFDVALGANFANKLYFGMTIGVQMVDWKRNYYYGEDYIYNGAPVDADGYLLTEAAEWMDYDQAVNMSGVGINLKLGLIYRPFGGLRLGWALHTPTFYSLDREYAARMATNFNQYGDRTPVLEDYGANAWDFVSPTRMMFGASYTFGRFAVISADYERTWYNGMRMKNIPDGFDILPRDYRYEVKQNYKGANTWRLGAEIRPLPALALRAGYGVMDSMLKQDKELYYNSPMTHKVECYSAGVGLAIGSASIDIAYQHLAQSQTAFFLFYAMDEQGVLDSASELYETKQLRDYVTLSLSFRF
ncbi:MAG: hypothetical protein J6B41_04630 [Alistipes sp.]|nr:hypothetical protein [Alistipes sp.]